MRKIYRQVVQREVQISATEAKALIVETRINKPGELDCYERSPNNRGYLSRVFTLKIDSDWSMGYPGEEYLLAHARNNIPNDCLFGTY